MRTCEAIYEVTYVRTCAWMRRMRSGACDARRMREPRACVYSPPFHHRGSQHQLKEKKIKTITLDMHSS